MPEQAVARKSKESSSHRNEGRSKATIRKCALGTHQSVEEPAALPRKLGSLSSSSAFVQSSACLAKPTDHGIGPDLQTWSSPAANSGSGAREVAALLPQPPHWPGPELRNSGDSLAWSVIPILPGHSAALDAVAPHLLSQQPRQPPKHSKREPWHDCPWPGWMPTPHKSGEVSRRCTWAKLPETHRRM